jgi:glyoxylase-like metal-dependent hydrolase (beta-lactamase superfamily II)
MFFRQILHEARACASYLVGCPAIGVCAAVDPQGDPQSYLEIVQRQGLKLTHVIETHIHADHPSCARQLADLSGAAFHLGPGADVRYDHLPLADGDTLKIGNRLVTVLHTPGHTPEHVCLLVDDWFILTGDTLFVGDVGRVDLALEDIPAEMVRGRAGQLYTSLQRLLTLPDHVEVYPGHYSGSVCGRGMDGKPSSTIGRERRFNPALRLSEAEFASFQLTDLPPLPADFQDIKRRNLGQA